VDTLLAFDCLEHVMSPLPILQDWYRVLRPGGRCLIEWFPYKGPWGPHMESLIPIPWAASRWRKSRRAGALSRSRSSSICGADDQLPQPNSSMSISRRAATASIDSKPVSGRLSVIIPIFMETLWHVGKGPRSAAEG